jgi:hypothetical protein
LFAAVAAINICRVTADNQSWADRLGRIGVDWWATIVAGVIAVLAVLNLLPKIPW